MKNKLMPLFLVLLVTALSCKKQVTSDCLKAKIIRSTCAGKVLQVLNNDSIGMDGWIDIYGSNTTRFNNVFGTSSCDIPSEYKVGDVVYVTVTEASLNGCLQCALYDAPPVVSYGIKSISNLPCNEVSVK